MYTDICSGEGCGTVHARMYAHVFHVHKICISKGQAVPCHQQEFRKSTNERAQNHCVTHQLEVTSAGGYLES